MDWERQFDKCIDERDVARSQLTMAEREVEIAAEQCCGLEDQLAALREELAAQKETVALFESEYSKQSLSLTAAKQRNADLVALLTEHQWEWEPYDSHNHRDGGYYCVECSESQKAGHATGCKIAAALKPTESGASE